MAAIPNNLGLNLPKEQLARFCARWRIVRLEIFGSALTQDFRPDSDVDFIATDAPDAAWSALTPKNLLEQFSVQ